MAQGTGSRAMETLCDLTEAKAALDQGERDRCRERLARALARGRPTGDTTWAMIGPKVMSQLYNEALTAGIEVDLVQDLIRRCRVPAPDPSTAAQTWPWPIRIFTFDRFRLLRVDEPLPMVGKAHRRPLDLLVTLIALGGREVPQEQIADALWPDADGDAAYRVLITNLQRLRQLLGCGHALELHDGRVTLDARWAWVDAWVFERLLDDVETARRHGDSATAQRLAEQALNLYEAPFAEHLAFPCIVLLRERLRNLYRRHLLDLAKDYETAERFEEALVWYQRGLRVDASCEAFHQRLVELYLRLGRSAEASDLYQGYLKLCSEALHRDPTPAIRALRPRISTDRL